MTFKDQMARDIENVFFNPTEFGTNVTINGQPQVVHIDDDELKARADKEYGGISTGMILYFVPASAFPAKPEISSTQRFNNRLMYVESAIEKDGVYEILLNQNRGL